MAWTLPVVLDELQRHAGPAENLPATDGWRLVLRENIAYLVADDVRDRCLRRLEDEVGLTPNAILAASDGALLAVVAGMRPAERVERLRRCAVLYLEDAPWKAYPGTGRPGVERIELFSGVRAVLALDSNALRVLYRLGYGEAAGYDRMYRQIQTAAQKELPRDAGALQRAHQLLRRHGRTVCVRTGPDCASCVLRQRCAAGTGARSLGDPFAKP